MATQAHEAAPEQQLEAFLSKYEKPVQELARGARARLREMLPGAIELVYDNYNGLAIGFGPTQRPSQAVLSLALNPRNVLLCFLRGVDLPDPEGLLQGSGNQVRNVRITSLGALDARPVLALIREAAGRAKPPFDAAGPRRLIIRSVSEKQRPRKPRTA